MNIHHRIKYRIDKHRARMAQMCERFGIGHQAYDIFSGSFLGGVFLFLVFFFTIAAPASAPNDTLLKIPAGTSVYAAGEILKSRHIIRSTLIFDAAARLFGTRGVIAGEYHFPGPQNVLLVGMRLAQGDFEITPVRVRLLEGATVKEMAQLLDKQIPDFDAVAFLKDAQPREGYLFPDTYFFLPGVDSGDVLAVLGNNFTEQMAQPRVKAAIKDFGKPLSDVIVMASLLEREAPASADRRVIAGILWKRIKLGMPLQVDAVFPYIIGKNSFQLTTSDLKTDSPYNTYTHKGLPPGPIANPGLDAILAAATPTATNYLYYLSDKQGNFHYSATYAQHLAYQKKYLRN